jgi:plasmid stabilization system protein ParE
MGGVEAIRAIRREFPPAKIIVLSTYQGDEEIYRALEVGAATFLIKNMLGEAMMRVIREVTAGGRPILPDVAQRLADRMLQPALTPREIDVLRLIARGQRNKEIAVLVQGTLDRFGRIDALLKLDARSAISTGIEECCRGLSVFPDRGAARDDLRILGFERRAVIAFYVASDRVAILRVLYGAVTLRRLWTDFRASAST